MIHVLETALPVFLTLGLGMLCRATRLLTAEGVKALKSVAVNITHATDLLILLEWKMSGELGYCENNRAFLSSGREKRWKTTLILQREISFRHY